MIPFAEATKVADELIDLFHSACTRIAIAGSLRRHQQTVGDVELLVIPRIVRAPDNAQLFADDIMTDLVRETALALCASGLLAKRRNANGREMFGDKNKFLVHVPSRIPIDLFSTTEDSWWNYLVCRTGGTRTNIAICEAAIARGWKWAPYGSGFTRDGDTKRMTSEQEVFDFVGLPFLPPEDRA